MASASVDLSQYAFDTFVTEHEAQLKQANVPPSLYRTLWQKLTQQVFDAGSVFVFGELDDEPEGTLGVFTGEGVSLQPASDIFLIDHAWTFASLAIARKQLTASAPLRERVASMMNLPLPDASDESNEATQAAIESIMSRLYRFGWLFEFVGKEGDAQEIVATTRLQNYFVLDELGSRFAQATSDEPANFTMEPFFFEPQQVAYSLCWPLAEVGEYERARHAAKMPMLDPDSQEYWEARYQYEGVSGDFDWYMSFAAVTDLFTKSRALDTLAISPSASTASGHPDSSETVGAPLLRSDTRVLMTGCGNSPFSADMYDAGYRHIVNMDYSVTCIEQMKAKYVEKHEMSWHVGDVTKLDAWSDNEFDLVVDKGCTDAILATDEDGASVSESALAMALTSFVQQRRVLRDSRDAHFVLISHGRPQERLPVLEAAGLVLQQYVPLQTEKTYEEGDLRRTVLSKAHVYICRKN